jgi:hypothetical protein
MIFARWLSAERRRSGWRWLETVLFTLLAAAIAYRASPSDPFLLKSEFPWLLLVPVLLALRYGALPGIASITILAALWWVEREAGIVAPEPPSLHLTGALMLTLLCGEFAGLWEAKASRAESSLRYVQEKLERLTRQYYLLLTSHQRLEQEQLVPPVTLRTALARIRRLASYESAAGELPGAQGLTALLAEFCQLEAASLHEYRGGAPAVQPAASIGPAQPLDPADPMVRYCLEHRTIAHVQTDELAGAGGSRYVVVAPLSSSDSELLGLFAVERMPFLALHEETLSMLAVALGYYADALRASRMARVMHRALPGCPLEFADELVRAHRMRAESKVRSSLLLLRFGSHTDSASFAAFIRREVRDLDMIWDIGRSADSESGFDMLILLPLAGEAGATDALERLESALEARYSVGFDAARIRPYATQIEGRDPFVELKLFLDLHDVRV